MCDYDEKFKEIISILLTHPDIDINVRNKKWQNACLIAKKAKNKEIQRLIISDKRYIEDKLEKNINTAFEKKCILIFIKELKEIHNSKIWGIPYWPKSESEYPKNIDNLALFHLASINFSEIHNIKELWEEWPTEWILQFYIDINDDLYWCDFDEPTNQNWFRVIYHQTLNFNQESFSNFYKWNYDFSPITTPPEWIWLSFELDISKPSGCIEYDELLEKWLIPKDYDEEDIDGFHHQIWWYPSFTQNDPRDSSEYILLFQLSSDDYVMFWDDWIANFFIKKTDLKNRDFSKVWYNWDCS